MTPASSTQVGRLLLSALILHLVLVQPNHPGAATWQALLLVPLELPVILLALLAAGNGRVAAFIRALLVGVLTLVAILKVADLITFTALGRGFNPVADLPLVDAMLRLVAGAAGAFAAIAAVVGALALSALLAAALWWATGVWSAFAPGRRVARIAAAGAMLAGVLAIAEIGHVMGRWRLPFDPPGAAFTARVAVERFGTSLHTLAELSNFNAIAADDPYADAATLLDAVDRDVFVIFVESYGRASFANPLYSAAHLATLREGERRLADLGMSMRSGFVAAPTQGGQSWLSHATFANGLWIADQTRYAAALISGRETLFHLAARSGFHTAAVMPQITMEWPEAAAMGFETILASRDLGYRGLPFNWVTMPDQFTLAAAQRLLDEERDGRRFFVQVALASSHAPWVPVPRLVAWEDVGDGTVFDAMAVAGDAPEIVWRDRDRIRDQYQQALDYSLRTVLDHLAHRADDPPLVFVVGDHQAAGFVAQDDRPDVPVHVIGPPHLVARIADWGWRPGLIPKPDGAAVPMSEMRNMILDAFTGVSVQTRAE